MTDKKKDLSNYEFFQVVDAQKKKVGIVTSEWNENITGSLEKACIETLLMHGILVENIFKIKVPGSFELPMGARLLAAKERLDGVICLGCVIRGETRHDQYISQAVANGIMQLQLAIGKPVIFGVLTPDNMEQAIERAGGNHGNKGTEAAITALKMMNIAVDLKTSQSYIGFGK
ncbi:MAG TPA: 6,7-dimethyl-8-ribityllumazine synthase [Saprospiraceae bacterium]|nr:6,7-dimethyl-8-ribityllumazine synthase [Saprospiraceae bacterium]